MNEAKDIRPYGIILVEADVKSNYPSPDNLFKEKKFTWKYYQNEITTNRNKMQEQKKGKDLTNTNSTTSSKISSVSSSLMNLGSMGKIPVV